MACSDQFEGTQTSCLRYHMSADFVSNFKYASISFRAETKSPLELYNIDLFKCQLSILGPFANFYSGHLMLNPIGLNLHRQHRDLQNIPLSV